MRAVAVDEKAVFKACGSAREHLRLHALSAAARVIEEAGRALGSHSALLESFPFVAGYLDAIDELPQVATLGWERVIERWQFSVGEHLPLRALSRRCNLEFAAIELLVAIGLIEEDGRFGLLFEAAQDVAGQQRPSWSLLHAWWGQSTSEPGSVSGYLRRIRELGLIKVANPDAPRSQWCFEMAPFVWDAMSGEVTFPSSGDLRYRPFSEVAQSSEPILQDDLEAKLTQLPGLIAERTIDAVIVRGPHHNGRRTLLSWLARELGRGVLEVELSGKVELDRERLRAMGALATLLDALPVLVVDPAPGEAIELPQSGDLILPVGVVAGVQGGLCGALVERAVTLTLEIPALPLRSRLLSRELAQPPDQLESLAERFRMTSGNLRRTARAAKVHAAIGGRVAPNTLDMRDASRMLGRQALDALATHVTEAGDFSCFASAPDTLRELRILEQRCKQRERLPATVGPALSSSLNCGVRALFQGPSGTGKTLAARLLATALQRDLYRVELAAVVNKYIGETEKSLARIFAAAEELDIILLFDEGDALLTRRTGVSNSNDRYANLETNFLLQRLEAFQGIVIVTTNAAELIDGAFARRMDAVVEFRSPDASERWSLWQLHLPAVHAIEERLLREVATRCQLTGGQVRNAVLHASLLALEAGQPLASEHLESAVQREYRKSGGVCPLRLRHANAAGRG